MSDSTGVKEYRFKTDENTLNDINAVEASLGLTHEEFVEQAAEFIDANQSQFKRFSRGETRT